MVTSILGVTVFKKFALIFCLFLIGSIALGDISIVNTTTPNINNPPQSLPQGRQNNPIFQFDIDPAGTNINFKSLSILVSGNIDTTNVSFEVFRYSGVAGSGSWVSLKGTQSPFTEGGLSTIDVTYSPLGYSLSTLTSFYIALNVSPTYNLTLTSFKISINSAAIEDTSGPLTVNIFTGQKSIFISGIQSNFTYSRYMVVTADGLTHPIMIMDFKPINDYNPTVPR